MKTLRYVICDVFTEQPLAGNPLAVFTDARGLSDTEMQSLAREMNLSETAFVLPAQAGGHARIRIFTPRQELPFAGHPILGTALVLGGPLECLELKLEVEVGVIPIELEREAARVSFGWMTQPRPGAFHVANGQEIWAALGLAGQAPELQAFENGPRHVYVPLTSARAVAELAPSFSLLSRATTSGVCAFHFDGESCKVRYFAPAAGIDEDPATGSAAGPLALALHGAGRLGPGDVLRIHQGSEVSRPSTLYARVGGEGEGEACVQVGGAARIVARGQFVI